MSFMKNVVKTEVVSIQLPSELVERIEKQIVVTEEYANRPDFIITAIRNYLEEFDGFFYLKKREFSKLADMPGGTYDPTAEEEMCKQIEENNARVLRDISKWKNIYDGFKGGSTRVVIRIPIGFRKRWNDIREFDVPIKNYLEFIRFSIITLVKHPKQDLKVELSKLSTQSLQEAHYKNAKR